MAPIIVLITGGNRGLGEGLVRRFLAEPNHVSITSHISTLGNRSEEMGQSLQYGVLTLTLGLCGVNKDG